MTLFQISNMLSRPLIARRIGLVFLAVAGLSLAAWPIQTIAQVPDPEVPELAPASDEGDRMIATFRVPDGINASLFAAEPHLANPVAIYVDYLGRVYVCETYRQQRGVEDNRNHMDWLDDDLAAQTVQDRLDYIMKHLGDDAVEYSRHDDRIRLLFDDDDDGKVDRATVFANRFNDIVAGTGAGVLEHRGRVYYTCIPDLWMLTDEDGDGQSDQRESLHTGYGVRFAFRGHDMHGLIVGPDGRLYFSIGDRGYHVVTEDGVLHDPASGAVFRCEMDGSNLELVATGLRNPQELAFDKYGNLFTGDNNSDSGDQARFVYVVRGSDTGWRMYYQYLNDRGPFNREKIWHPFHDDQPAYIVPPITNIADGPSGLTYYPGTGFGQRFDGCFLLCDFRGQASNSGIRSFRLQRDGAFFELTDSTEPFWHMLVTDATFGPDGSLYVSDWVHGWEGLNKGRIYRFQSASEEDIAEGQQVAQLLGGDLFSSTDEQLSRLLSHSDQRIRTESQFELVDRNRVDLLLDVATAGADQLARLHAIWGLGQLGRADALSDESVRILISLASDSDEEVRCQAITVLGEMGAPESIDALIAGTTDDSLRVRYFAADALGMLGEPAAFGPIVDLLHENANDDPIVRHGGIMGLVGVATDQQLLDLANHPSRYVRLACVVAMRKRNLLGVEVFLGDVDSQVREEAARAIHDLPLLDAYPALASLIHDQHLSSELARRVINANFRLGQSQHAEGLLDFITSDHEDADLRLEVLDLIASWSQPASRDWVLGDWRPMEERGPQEIRDILREYLPSLLTTSSAIAAKSSQIAADLEITEIIPYLEQSILDEANAAADRADGLLALYALDSDRITELTAFALQSDHAVLRAAAREVMAKSGDADAVSVLQAAIYEGEPLERQNAAALLSELTGDTWREFKRELAAALRDQSLANDIELEILEMAEGSRDPLVGRLLTEIESGRDPEDPLSLFRESLSGGDPEIGRTIFFDRRDLSCRRCHVIGDEGGDVGPDLTKIAETKDSEYLLKSIVTPNSEIAEGFETLLVVTIDGHVLSGIAKHQDDEILQIMTAEGETITIPVDDVEETQRGESSMPGDLIDLMSKRDLRDLLAFLRTLQ